MLTDLESVVPYLEKNTRFVPVDGKSHSMFHLSLAWRLPVGLPVGFGQVKKKKDVG